MSVLVVQAEDWSAMYRGAAWLRNRLTFASECEQLVDRVDGLGLEAVHDTVRLPSGRLCPARFDSVLVIELSRS
ncbi:hypothetical protein A6A25_40275 [Saccharothrix sp. CB00851]|nr:hypothetical protein A6A25_40275 [Saccharothrix sp. CB00851]